MKPTVGLTGGIATGKSTVARLFRDEHGVPVVDADQLSRDVVEPGTPGLAAVVEAFGSEVLAQDGGLDRAKLGSIVFGDAKSLETLNGILHPRIAQLAMERLSALGDHPSPYLLYEAALLVENNIHKMFPALVVVTISPEVQLARLMGRDEFNREEAEARIASQMPLTEKAALADLLIENDGTLDDLRAKVAAAHLQLLERFAPSAHVDDSTSVKDEVSDD